MHFSPLPPYTSLGKQVIAQGHTDLTKRSDKMLLL